MVKYEIYYENGSKIKYMLINFKTNYHENTFLIKIT